MPIIKDLKSYSVNLLYFIFRYVNEYFEEINGNKYLMLVPTTDSKEKIRKYKELWSTIRDLIRSIAKNSDDYDTKHMNVKCNSDENLPLSKIEILIMTIVVWAVLHENNKYYLQDFSDECLYKI